MKRTVNKCELIGIRLREGWGVWDVRGPLNEGYNMVREREKGWNFIISGQFDVHKGPNLPSHFTFLQSDTGVWAYTFFSLCTLFSVRSEIMKSHTSSEAFIEALRRYHSVVESAHIITA
jgi:hypothetical protein